MILAKREFGHADQKRFACVSGDYNPMHVDAVQARRTPAGAPVVHGMNLLLWALDSLIAAQPDLPPLCGFRAQFTKFVYLNETVCIELAQQGPTDARLNVSVDGSPRSNITINFGDAVKECSNSTSASLERLPIAQQPMDLVFEQMSGRSGSLPFQMMPDDAMALFPAATRWFGARRVAAVAASSCLIGMVCPGLHSVYRQLSVELCADPNPEGSLAFRVTATDSRFRSIDQEIEGGGLIGTVKSLARTPPVEQPTIQSLAGLIAPGEFAGSVALIVGGSRGLGELTAKIIAKGGGHVIITWQSGRDDAERVAQEIRAAGGTCETLAYDARKLAAEQLATLANSPSHAYYFATPTIYRPQAEIFMSERLEDFLKIYVAGFWQLSLALRARQPQLSIFYPSTVFVTDRPKGMTEYAMAKAAGEALCADMNAFLAPTHVTVSRLPRLPTDQTASVTARAIAHPLDTLLPVIREVQSWPGKRIDG